MSPLRQLSPLSQRIVGSVVLVLALTTVGSTAYYSHEQRQATECQAEFNIQFIDQIKERNRISESDRESLATLVKEVTNSKSREERRKALEDYIKTKDKNDAERREHPYPELPEKSAHC